LLGDASGTTLYVGIVWSMADEAAAHVARIATERGLVCYDPQSERLLTPRAAAPQRAWLGWLRRR
jgi:hypothetical protein